MSDFIKISPPPNQSTISGLLIPEEDGTFVVTVTAYAESIGQPDPSMWGDIDHDGIVIGEQTPVGWENGPASIEIVGAIEAVKGKTYRVHGKSGNKNARATGIKMTIERA